MAIDASLIRKDKLAAGGDWKSTGVDGNPARSTVEYGKKALDLKVEAAVAEIRASIGEEMNLELEGSVVLITGGSKGIGLACARAFAREGARVAIASRSAENLERAQKLLRQEGVDALTVVADLRVAEDAVKMADEVEKKLGPISILVNSAGAANRTPPGELTAKHWQDAMQAKYFTYITRWMHSCRAWPRAAVASS
jgi:hypothetical protein